MKILVYGINYYPELTGIGKYTGEMCEWLAAKGHDVEVITGKPYYPEWKIRAEYKHTGWHTEVIKGVKVKRAPLYVPQKVSGFSRIVHETSFFLSSLLYWIPTFFKSYDVVISICPPLQTNFLPWMYSFLRRKPFVLHVQDLQVDVANELGLIRNKFLIGLLKGVEKFLLKRASLVSTISEGMKRRILEKGVKENKLILFPNWVDTAFIKPLESCPLKKEIGFKDTDKVVLYSGSMGEKQGLEMVIEAAERLKNVPSLFFLFSGDGPAKPRLIRLAEEKGLCNILFINAQPYERFDELLALGDIHLIIQKKSASDLVFPSKLAAVLSAGGLALITAEENTDLFTIVHNNNIGVLVPPEDAEALAASIHENLTTNASGIKKNARNFALQMLDKNKIMTRFENNLSLLIS